VLKFKSKLEGKRIFLRRLTPDDASILLDVIPRNREDILSWMAFKESQIIPKDKNDAIRIIKDINSWESDGDAVYYGIFIKDKFIGIVMADLYLDDNHAEPGTFLDACSRGNGYAKEARLLLESELFSSGITKIVVSVDKENQSCINMINSLGYRKIKEVKNNFFSKFRNEYRDELIFEKLKTN
jgi:RimJ/RimL family protein N-acetyltransferase